MESEAISVDQCCGSSGTAILKPSPRLCDPAMAGSMTRSAPSGRIVDSAAAATDMIWPKLENITRGFLIKFVRGRWGRWTMSWPAKFFAVASSEFSPTSTVAFAPESGKFVGSTQPFYDPVGNDEWAWDPHYLQLSAVARRDASSYQTHRLGRVRLGQASSE